MPLPDDMTDLDRPVTRRELRAELQITQADLRAEIQTTKADFRAELQIVKADLRAELEAVLKTLATKEDLKAYATKEDLKAYATKEDLKAVRDDLRRHFDVTAESFRSEFRNLFDWVHANTTSLAGRVEAIETGHGARLLGLETRVTRLESDRSIS